MKKLALLALALVAASSHAALVLDDFTTGNYDSGLISSGSDIAWTPASVPGGIRATFLGIQANENEFDARLRAKASAGVFAVSNDPGVDSYAQLAYGAADGNVVVGSNPLDLDLSGSPLIGLNFRSNDLDLGLEVILVTGSGVYSRSTTVLGGTMNSFVGLDFSSDMAALGDVDGILFNFDPMTDGDFAVTSVEAVPEPATMAALGIGLAALARRRRASK